MEELRNNMDFDLLVTNIETAVKDARETISTKINNNVVDSYWTVGRYIVEFEQDGNNKAEYGKNLLSNLSKELTLRLGKGFGRSNLNNMRRFYLYYPNLNISSKLTWSHICELIKIDDDLERVFYEKQCVIENWSYRTLKKQIESSLFLRLAASRDKEGILSLAQQGQIVQTPDDIIKDTYTLNF